MEFRTPTVSPLRQRMLDDMRMRKLQPRTQAGYIRAVRRLTIFLDRAPDTATADDLRRFQLHLVDQGASPITINATLTGLKFFFEITLSRGDVLAKIQPVRVPQTLPVVLSQDEVARLLAAVTNLKHHTALSLAYGTGLRASEVIGLKVGVVVHDLSRAKPTLRRRVATSGTATASAPRSSNRVRRPSSLRTRITAHDTAAQIPIATQRSPDPLRTMSRLPPLGLIQHPPSSRGASLPWSCARADIG